MIKYLIKKIDEINLSEEISRRYKDLFLHRCIYNILKIKKNK